MKSVVSRWILASACGVAGLIVSTSARAQEGAQATQPEPAPAPPTPPAPTAPPAPNPEPSAEAHAEAHGEEHAGADKHAEEATHEAEETKLQLGIDFVVGFGKTPLVTSVPSSANPAVQESTVGDSQVMSESFVIGGSYEIAKHFGVGLRLPFAMGTFSPPGRTTRSTTALGSLELEGEYEMELAQHLKIMYALGVALPTAQGDEVPTQEELDKLTGAVDQNNFDRYALNRAIASSRGFEENALFEPKRLGIIPKIGMDYEVSNVLVQPYVKLENLVSTVGGAEHSYLGELVFGTFLGYRLHEMVDAGARVWGNVPIAGGGTAVGVVEPQIRGHFGNVSPILGGIIPFAGPLTSPQFAGLRLALAARF